MRLVFGIGNPGPEYEGTRHNIGFAVLDALAARAGARWEALPGTPARTCRTTLQGAGVLLVEPLSYVNRCGPVLAGLLAQEAVAPEDLLVVVDDYQLPLGRLRLRGRGSDGGHNGLRSIIESLGTEVWPRLRVGIGHPGDRIAHDYVLRPFDRQERPAAEAAVRAAAEAVGTWLRLGLERAMNDVNRADLDQPPDPA